MPIPIDYKIYFRVKAGMRSRVFGGDLVWVPGLVIGSSLSSLVVSWGTMAEIHVVGLGIVTHSQLLEGFKCESK